MESMKFVFKGDVEHEFEKLAETIDSLCCRNDAGDGAPDDDGLSIANSLKYERKVVISIPDTKPNLRDSKYRHVMRIGVGLLVAQQFSGQPSVLAYSRVLFEAAGWKGHASVVTVTIMGITSAITVSLVDKLGRKILLSAGCIIMAVALVALTFGFWGWDESDDTALGALKADVILVSMFIFISGYQVGFGPITWTVLSEIYPSEIRGTAMAFSVEVNFLSKFLCQLLFPIIQDILGWGCTFILFTCIVVSSLIFINTEVPETKGMSLEEIQIQLKRLVSKSDKKEPRMDASVSTDSSRSSPLLSPSSNSETSSLPLVT